MIRDRLNNFSEEQAITASAASTNVIDTRTVKDISKGAPVKITGRVTEAFNNLTSLNVAIQTDTVENFASPTTLASVDVLLADLDAIGDLLIDMYLPRGAQRYLRLNYTVTGTAPTTGAVDAGVVLIPTVTPNL